MHGWVGLCFSGVVWLVAVSGLGCFSGSGKVDLRIVDAETGLMVPARVELIDDRRSAHIPESALPIDLECLVPPPNWWNWGRTDHLYNPATETDQFYLSRRTSISLPPGRYRLRGFRGIEYEVAEHSFDVISGETTTVELALKRWIDLPSEGWFSADDHLHIRRETAADDVRIAAWMTAEDLHVANLLEMGTSRGLLVTQQHHFGEDGVHESQGHLLVSGQEHPRTHFLGHTLTLGADRRIDPLDTYIVYETTFAPARAEGAATGFAHYGRGPAEDGLAIDAPRQLVDFVEVLQFEHLDPQVWYALLNLGIRLAPTAGTDFPCGPYSVPGRERFYTRVDGPLSREAWVEGIRNGRTFVTNGPILDFTIDGAGPGEEVRLEGPGEVEIRGRVRFDPNRDDVKILELVRNGEVVARAWREPASDQIELSLSQRVLEPAWFALRVSGDKRGEAPMKPFLPAPEFALRFFENFASGAELGSREEVARRRGPRPSLAHTAAVWIALGDSPVRVNPTLVEDALARLEELEARLSDERVADQTIWDFIPYSDGVSLEHLQSNRPALLTAIAEARRYYRSLLNR
ncbi:CehA/McbA family metallohydrolase [Myxococcota bacterium]|nr:CehA/McbA family metallohydrolase [Myxococcota bacterium]